MVKKFIFSLITVYCLLSTTAFAQSVDLLWYGDTYTPPFYQGKSLWGSQSVINIVAITQGLGDPSKLNYKWTKSGTILGNISGVGKNTLSFTDSVVSNAQNIKVDIVATGEYNAKILASASVYVIPTTPRLAVYENNPLYGFMFHREVGSTFNLEGEEVTFTAFPFLFSASDRRDSSLSYEWKTNSGEAETKNSVTYRVPEGESGESKVEVNATRPDKLLQSANTSFLIEFGK